MIYQEDGTVIFTLDGEEVQRIMHLLEQDVRQQTAWVQARACTDQEREQAVKAGDVSMRIMSKIAMARHRRDSIRDTLRAVMG